MRQYKSQISFVGEAGAVKPRHDLHNVLTNALDALQSLQVHYKTNPQPENPDSEEYKSWMQKQRDWNDIVNASAIDLYVDLTGRESRFRA